MADIPSTNFGVCQKWEWEILLLLFWTEEEPAASATGNYSKVELTLRVGDVKSSNKFSRMKKTTRTLVIVSVAMEGNSFVAALWCMVETMTGSGRYRQGAGQMLARHSLSVALLPEGY